MFVRIHVVHGARMQLSALGGRHHGDLHVLDELVKLLRIRIVVAMLVHRNLLAVAKLLSGAIVRLNDPARMSGQHRRCALVRDIVGAGDSQP